MAVGSTDPDQPGVHAMKCLFLAMLIPLVNACSGRLEVRVDTLDPAYVSEQVSTRSATSECQKAVAETIASIDAEIKAIAADLKQYHELVYRTYVSAIGNDIDSSQRAVLVELAEQVRISDSEAVEFYELNEYRSNRVGAMIAVHKAALNANASVHKAGMKSPAPSPCTMRDTPLNDALYVRRDLIATESVRIGKQTDALRAHAHRLGGPSAAAAPVAAAPVAAPPVAAAPVAAAPVAAPPVAAAPAAAPPAVVPSSKAAAAVAKAAAAGSEAVAESPAVIKSQQAITRRVNSVLGPGALSLAATPYAYIISSAPDGYWQRNFNQAIGSGVMGNLDIAIILNETADFSVKGMRFDASKVAEVASKVTSQALHLAVQMSGVAPLAVAGSTPVSNSPSTPETTTASTPTALARSTASLATAQAQEAVRNTMLQTRTRALFDLADTLSANYDLVTDSNKDATAASIGARLSAQLPLLKLVEPTSTPD